eukprot:1103762_1
MCNANLKHYHLLTMSLSFLTIIFGIFRILRSQVTTPTSGNATHQYFDTSSSLLYASDSIICASPYCHIICDEPSGCYNTNIDASSSDTLIVECLSTSSCERFNITAGPTTDLHVFCKGDTKSCYYGGIKALTTTNINVFCNDSNTNLATACMYLRVITSQASTVNMECVSSHSCFQAAIAANTMNGNINLICAGDNACDQFTVDATDMGSSSVVHVLCDTASNITQACETTFINCPTEGTCNIDCISPGGCWNTQITIPNQEYIGLNLYCADTFADDSCITSDFVCTDTAQSSQLVYDTTYARWTCETYGCCPFKDGDAQSCASGNDCEIYCNTGKNCKNSIINGSLANSLTVNCIGTRCNGALILCPFGDNTACTILCNGTAATGGPCDETLIRVGNGNIMDSFSLYCDFHGGAYDESGCARAQVVFDAASIADVIVDARGHADARYMIFEGNGVIGNFKLDCDECEYSTFDLKISQSVDVNCGWGGACYRMESTFTSTGENVDYSIDCTNLDGSQYNKACHGAKWWVHGFNDTANNNQRTNNVTLHCASNDCHSTSLFGYSLLNADVDCIGHATRESACWYATMDLSMTDSFNLNCVGYWTCRETDIYCPHSEPNSCRITCDDSSLPSYASCKQMQIHVPDSFTWGYLDLTCAASGACDGLGVNCNQAGTPWRLQASYVWDATSLNYQCTDDSTSFCCPYYNSTDEVGGCSTGVDCVVDCVSSSCSSTIIDGSEASYLDVSCAALSCQNTVIHCPVGGCNVLCNDTYACRYASIVYGGIYEGNVTITCEGERACTRTLMDMNFVNELVLTCTGENSRACDGLNFEANYANKVVITANGRYAMETESTSYRLNMRHAGQIIINAIGTRALYDYYIYAQYAGSMEFNLAADMGIAWPIYSNEIYVPNNVTFNCYGYGCNDLNNLRRQIDTATGLEINLDTCEVCDGASDCLKSFNLYCDGTNVDHFTYGSCHGSNECGCVDLMDKISVTTVYEEQKCYTPRSTQTCTGQCTFTCDVASTNNCADYILDGRGASSLTVTCGDSAYCQDTIVYCPLSGCTITCDAENACNGATIIYEGTISDAGTVEINCNAWTNACYDVKWDAQNAKSVIINGMGADSMVSSVLRADNAETVTVTLSADAGTSTTQSMQWFVPQSTTFNCFGTGCANLDQINRGSIVTSTGFAMNVASCAQCTSAKACLQSFNLTCISGVDEFSSSDPCTSDNTCGCSDVVSNNIAFTSGYEDAGCLTSLTVQTCQSNKDCVVDCASTTCANEVIDGQTATSLTVNCGPGSSYCASTFIHCPSVGCDIHCIGSSVCTNAKLVYDGLPADDGLVTLECNGGNKPCHTMIINAENAAVMQLFLESDTYPATYAMQWYVPQNTTFNCFGKGCQSLNEIYRGDSATADGLSFNIETCNQCDTLGECLTTFDLHCVNGEDIFDSGLCNDQSTDNTCGCSDVMRMNTQFERTYQGARCSTNRDIEVCATGVPCVMNCDSINGNCTDKVIDATLATHLSVICTEKYYCRNTVFECPIGGCSVVCNASYACQSAKVVYSGQITDAGTVQVDCITTSTTSKSCYYLSITAPDAYQVDLACLGAVDVYNDACEYVELNADFANKVSISLSEKYASNSDTWNVRYAKTVIFDARGTGTSVYAIDYGELFAQYADYVEINLAADLATTKVPHYTQWYIPQNTTFNCFGYGCYELYEVYRGDIATADGLQFNVFTCDVCTSNCFNSFYLKCVVDGSTAQDNCYGSSNYNDCGCKDAMSAVTITTDYREQRCLTPRTVITCSTDSHCVVDCNVNGAVCADKVIDGSLALSLSVSCTDDYHCQNTVVYCPDSGCDITCDNNRGCDAMNVIYEGQVVDNGAITIDCVGQYSCQYMEVNADTVYSIDITCRESTAYSCYYLELNANNAGQVAIHSHDNRPTNYATWNIQNAGAVTISGRGQYSFSNGVIHADNAGSADITLIGMETYSAAASMEWYLPDTTTFNCYGLACSHLNNIHRSVNAATGLVINVETCGQCTDINDCLVGFTLYCPLGQDSFFPDQCLNQNVCGCTDLITNNIHIAATYGEPLCYSPYTRDPTTAVPTAIPTSSTSDPTTLEPTLSPVTVSPTSATSEPSSTPTTRDPTSNPTTHEPSLSPIIGTRSPITANPTSSPNTFDPTSIPSETPTTLDPSAAPIIGTKNPTTPDPTSHPITANPSFDPSTSPITLEPTTSPVHPTTQPTSTPVVVLPASPTASTADPTEATGTPSTEAPTLIPSSTPTQATLSPTYSYRSNWYLSELSFSWSDMGCFAAYDDVNSRIWAFGGYTRGFVSTRENIMYYDINSNAMVNMSAQVSGYNQFTFSRAGSNVAVVDRTLYFMHNTYYNAVRLMSFDMDTLEFNSSFTTSLPITSAGESPCTTSYDNKLYFVGGANDVRFYVFDLIQSEWILGRDMTESRTYCSCAIVNGYLYIWNGGVTTVQKTNINALEFAWITVATVPSFNTVGMASVVSEHAIIAIGGYRSDSIKARDTVYMIDTRDDTVIDYTELPDLQLPSELARGYHQAIFAYNSDSRIYLIQGVYPAANTNSLIYSDYIVIPTYEPTQQPTMPTSDPITYAPTSPTLAPIPRPTNSPTVPTSSPEHSVATLETNTVADIAASHFSSCFVLLLFTFFVFFE